MLNKSESVVRLLSNVQDVCRPFVPPNSE